MRPHLARALCTLLLLAPATALIGCATDDADVIDVDVDPTPAIAGADFEAVPRTISATEVATRRAALTPYRDDLTTSAAGDSFYLAIKKSALGDRFFLSGYLQQYFPGGAAVGSATSLGTKVVSFRIQNGKLYLLDVSVGTASSDVFDPDLIVDAFPIVEERDFKTSAGKETYVVIDPAAGLNRFNLVSDSFASSGGLLSASQPNRFEIELSFSQAFRKIDDGATWQLVFTGYGDRPLTDPKPDAPKVPAVEPNRLRASGTLGMSLRRYRESDRYVPVPMAPLGTDPAHEFFFRGPARLVRNTGIVEQVAAHWAIYPGMKPIEWILSNQFAVVDATPAFADVDLVGASRRAVESWNQAFGFPVFTTRLARPGEDFGQDDKNVIVLDTSAEVPFAFADWRTNPSTGETRGASVYVSAIFLTPEAFSDNPPPPAKAGASAIRLGWDGLASSRLCNHPALDTRSVAADKRLTGAQKFERLFGQVLAHEVGHTLGLRHNFKGTLVAPTASIMDYTLNREAIAQGAAPAAYDIAAVRFLYGLDKAAPAQAFCTDEQLTTDADCQQFDRGADPLADFHVNDYVFTIQDILAGGELPPFFNDVVNGLYPYLRVGTPAQATLAWQTAIADVGAPLAADLGTQPAAIGFANQQLSAVLAVVAKQRTAAIDALIAAQARLVARNVDGVRPPALRRQAIDTLKALQSFDGFEGLRTLRAELASTNATDRVESLMIADLIARIDRATSPYFD